MPGPDRSHLYNIAEGQAGLFLASQAAEAGYSAAVLSQSVRSGLFRRLRRGIYRFVQFPPHEQEELVALWLWSETAGVFSYESALSLHGLSDVLPARLHLTLPATPRRRLRPPANVVLHWADLTSDERTWVGSVPVTTVPRTLADCARSHVPQEFLDSAIEQALNRGLVTKEELEAQIRAIQADRKP